jgi:hypothetical protein
LPQQGDDAVAILKNHPRTEHRHFSPVANQSMLGFTIASCSRQALAFSTSSPTQGGAVARSVRR